MISGETLTDYAGVQITTDESATAIGGPDTAGNIVILARNDGGGDAIERFGPAECCRPYSQREERVRGSVSAELSVTRDRA